MSQNPYISKCLKILQVIFITILDAFIKLQSSIFGWNGTQFFYMISMIIRNGYAIMIFRIGIRIHKDSHQTDYKICLEVVQTKGFTTMLTSTDYLFFLKLVFTWLQLVDFRSTQMCSPRCKSCTGIHPHPCFLRKLQTS